VKIIVSLHSSWNTPCLIKHVSFDIS
jgi:hypothetical protein